MATPAYGDIFNYLDPRTEGAHDTSGVYGGVPGTGWATPTQGDIIGYHTEHQGGGEGGTVDVQVPDYAQNYTIDQSKIPDKYKGLVSQYTAAGGGSQGDVGYDFSKLPNGGVTKYGHINDMTSLGMDQSKGPTMFNDATKWGGRHEDSTAVQDPSKVYWDDNYGWITPQNNIFHPIPEKNGVIDTIGNIGMMAGLAAMGMPELGGSLGGGLAASAFGGIKNYGETGNWKNSVIGMAPGLIGAGLGLSGISMPSLPPALQQAMQLAKYAKTGYGVYKMIRGG